MRSFSQGICEAIAADFMKDSVDLATAQQEEGVTYQIEGYLSHVRTQREDGSVSLLNRTPTANVVGGITFALAEQGEIPVETATPENVAKICFVLGQLTTPQPSE